MKKESDIEAMIKELDDGRADTVTSMSQEKKLDESLSLSHK